MSTIRSPSLIIPLTVLVSVVTVSCLILRSLKPAIDGEDTENKHTDIPKPRVEHADETARDDAKSVTDVSLTETQPPERAENNVNVDAPHDTEFPARVVERGLEEVISCEPAAVNLASTDVEGSEVDEFCDIREPLAFEELTSKESCAVGDLHVSEERQEPDELNADYQCKNPMNSDTTDTTDTDTTGDSGYEELAVSSSLNWKANVFIPSSAPPSPQLDSLDHTEYEANGSNATLHNYGPAVKKIRCKYWPRCTNKNCKFVHPRLPCRNDGFCQFGEKCIFIHSADNVTIDYSDLMRRKSRGSKNSLHDQFVDDDRNGNGH